MRFYQHNLGDWAAHTMHLPWMELAAYHKLIEAYYIAESALPGDLQRIYRLTHAITKNERDAVRNVLDEFFTLERDGLYHQKRCDAEIARQQKTSEQQRENVSKRWNGRANGSQLVDNLSRHDENASVSKTTKRSILDSRLRGNVDNYLEHSGALESIPAAYGGNTVEDTAVIPPMNHEPEIHKKHAEVAIVEACKRAAVSARAVGFKVDPEDPRLVALVADGATPGEVAVAAAKAAAMGKPWAYAIGTLSGMRRDAAKHAQEGPKSGSGAPYRMLPRASDPHD